MNSQALLSILMQSHDATAIYTGEELTIQWANDAMLSIWGKEKSVNGQSLEAALPEMEGQPFTELLKTVWRTGESYEATETAANLFVDGRLQTFYFDFMYRAIKDDEGKMYCILHTATEVSERMETWEGVRKKEATEHRINEELNATNEQLSFAGNELEIANVSLQQSILGLNAQNRALGLSERKALGLFEDAPVAIGLLHGPQLVIATANAALLELWGKSDDIIGMPLAQGLPEQKGQPFLDVLTQVMQNGEPYYGNETEIVLERNGTISKFYFNLVYKPVKDKVGRTHSVVMVANDVTPQVEACKETNEINDRLTLAMNAGTLGSYDLEIASGEMECNAQFKHDLGFPEHSTLTLKDLNDAILPEYREYVQQQVSTAIAHNQAYHAEFEIQWPEGIRRWIRATGQPNYDEHGNPLRIVGITQDITERKAYEQRKDDFISIASHELKTPVTALKAYLQLLERMKSKITDPLAEKLIENASGSINRITVLIDDLLNIGKHSGGKPELNKTYFDICKLISSCCNHIRIAGKHQLHQTGEKSLVVFADEERIDQVLVNFVNNAVKYASQSKDIYLDVEKRENSAKISVSDGGDGIAKEQLPHLFDRYWQANQSPMKYTGLGLGLYICSETVKRHGGSIGVESKLGTGSTFWFTLPLGTLLK